MVYLLPYTERKDIYDQINLNRYYRMAENVAGCAQSLSFCVCPSNPFAIYKDTSGLTAAQLAQGQYWGTTDYFATVYTSISDGSNPANPKTGLDDKTNYRLDGALSVDNTARQYCPPVDGGEGGFFASATSVPISAVSDGTSNTICFIEDAGRISPGLTTGTPLLSGPYKGSARALQAGRDEPGRLGRGPGRPRSDERPPRQPGRRRPTAVWRWADFDACGSGVSGPANSSAIAAGYIPASDFDAAGDYIGKVINQLAYPLGGPLGTGTVTGYDPTKGAWTYNNAGLNDEPFSFHPGGCNASMVDGSVRFLSDSIDPITMRYLVSRAEAKTTTTMTDALR